MKKPAGKMLHSLDSWIEYIQTLHAREIDLDLTRTRDVYRRLIPNGISACVISVAGTNGKGSTAEYLNSVYLAAGYKVGKYTSPHLVKFNERIQINGQDVRDEQLLRAFEVVEAARQSTPLTYFEFGTLLAIYLFHTANLDLFVLEVGLGGRLDAVNILDCDLAIITSISIDHTAWLGNTVEQIAREKAGIVRKGKPAVIGEVRNNSALISACKTLGAECFELDKDFSVQLDAVSSDTQSTIASLWHWQGSNLRVNDLPLPFGQSGVQLNNAACVVQAVTLLQERLPVEFAVIRTGLARAKLVGRCQVVSQRPFVIVDVAHNEDSVAILNEFLKSLKIEGKVHAVCGMLKDKEIATSLARISSNIDVWHLATIKSERGSSAAHIAGIVATIQRGASNDGANALNTESNDLSIYQYDDIVAAFRAAQDAASTTDCIVVFGSFYVVADILPHCLPSPDQ